MLGRRGNLGDWRLLPWTLLVLARVPAEDSDLLHITLLEFLGVCFNILMFDHMIVPGSLGGGNRRPSEDGLAPAALTLLRESQKSAALVHAYQWMKRRPEWQRFSPLLKVQHQYGDAKVMVDAVSRARWGEFHRRCAQIGVSPQPLALCPAARALYSSCVNAAKGSTLAGEASFSFADFAGGAFKITRKEATISSPREARP